MCEEEREALEVVPKLINALKELEVDRDQWRAKTEALEKEQEIINLTTELSRLLIYVSKVAIAIRMNSAYNTESIYNPNTPYDVMWLSDCLHNLDLLGSTIQENDAGKIILACEHLLGNYASYQRDNTGHKSDPKPSFERNKEIFSLQDGIEIFTDIKAKIT